MNVVLIYPLIVAAGVLQAWGPPMNGALRNALTNPWLASLVSFLPVVAFLGTVYVCLPYPIPSIAGVSRMPWWAPLGGLIGAVAVVAGLLFVDTVGAGTLAALTISANLVMSLLIDNFGMFHMPVHALNIWRVVGAVLMIGGVCLITWF